MLPRGSGESYSSSCRRSLRGIALEAQTRISPCTLWGASVTHGSTFLPERLIGRERVSIPFTERGTGMGRGSGKSVNCRAAARQMGDIGIGRHQEHQFSPTVQWRSALTAHSSSTRNFQNLGGCAYEDEALQPIVATVLDRSECTRELTCKCPENVKRDVLAHPNCYRSSHAEGIRDRDREGDLIGLRHHQKSQLSGSRRCYTTLFKHIAA